MVKRIILDTDIGTDVDDCLALAFILGSPELHLEAITCVYGDVGLRARMLHKLLGLAGQPHIPVMTGSAETLTGAHKIYWGGHEGQGLLNEDDLAAPLPDSDHAVDYLVHTVMSNPGEFHLLAIGPLTNIALAIRREPTLLAYLASLMIMGGVFRGPSTSNLPAAEHNFKCDPEAAQIVMTAGGRASLVPLDVTTRVVIRVPDLVQLRSSGMAFHDAVATQLELYPRFAADSQTLLHDPLAAALMVKPELAQWESLNVEIETAGRLTNAVSVGVATDAASRSATSVALGVDSHNAESFIVSRMASLPASHA